MGRDKYRQYVSFDWAIKRVLRSKANFGVLEGFLSELLRDDITILEILESESNKDFREQKYNVVDLKVKNAKGELIIVEVQYDRDYSIYHRILYGTSRVITEHLHETESYDQIQKVISVNLLYFDLKEGEDYVYHGSTSFVGIHNKDVLGLNRRYQEKTGKENIDQIFPEYYIIKINQFNDLAKDSLDEWIYFLKNEEIKPEFKARGLEAAKKVLDYSKLDKNKRDEYHAYIDARRVNDGLFKTKFEDGLKEGELKGLTKTAQKMLAKGLSLGIISECTGLAINEIAALKNTD